MQNTDERLDHKADKDLLLAIIEEGSLKNIIWPNISDKMQAKNYTFTKEACRQVVNCFDPSSLLVATCFPPIIPIVSTN